MTDAATTYRFTLEEFVRAWEAGVFQQRVELVDGEVWPVPIGDWHGTATGRVVRALPDSGYEVTLASLASSGSLPDPDCWVRPVGAQPAGQLSTRLAAWSPHDVLLVVEVGDETLGFDLGVKASLYGRSGYGCYWVVSRRGIYEHTGPHDFGYAKVELYPPRALIPVRYSGTDLAVTDLLPPE